MRAAIRSTILSTRTGNSPIVTLYRTRWYGRHRRRLSGTVPIFTATFVREHPPTGAHHDVPLSTSTARQFCND